MNVKKRFELVIIISMSALGLLSSCSSPTGPVNIRDRNLPPVQQRESEDQPIAIAKAHPVVPAVKPKTLPLIERLTDQANNALKQQQFNQAIEIAERGLRIDRKQGPLYLVLAQAYDSQNNLLQARYFAQQGLLYVKRDSEVYQKLKFWVQ